MMYCAGDDDACDGDMVMMYCAGNMVMTCDGIVQVVIW